MQRITLSIVKHVTYSFIIVNIIIDLWTSIYEYIIKNHSIYSDTQGSFDQAGARGPSQNILYLFINLFQFLHYY